MVVEKRWVDDDAQRNDFIEGLFAYDVGCTDSGIRDERRKHELLEWVSVRDKDDLRKDMARLVREVCLSEARLAQGHGLADAAEFMRWLEYELNLNF